MGSLKKPHILDTDDRWQETEDEYLWWPRILWIDPGVVSGVACIWFDPKALVEGLPLRKTVLAWFETYLYGPENGRNGQVNRFLRMRHILSREVGLATGVERFTLLRLEQSSAFLSPVRIRAGIEFGMSISDKPDEEILVQSPGDAMTTFTDSRLRALDMYTPGPDHIRDGTRHGLLHIRKLNNLSREDISKVHGEEEGWWD